ncbi:plexin A3-like [Daktulosphaira vitifoliae]|uniref:plexin A3-like n=1 Tax=Daktulosphaira vitifoliae TaxID=58002 RepID=UPI0021A99159|nr:plexin A3-like [Daktulosphaira vitifoliae]
MFNTFKFDGSFNSVLAHHTYRHKLLTLLYFTSLLVASRSFNTIDILNMRNGVLESTKSSKIGSSEVIVNSINFNCSTYKSCTECVTSLFLCDWCMEKHICTSSYQKQCIYDAVITNKKGTVMNARKGPYYCPKVNVFNSENFEILIPSDQEELVKVNVDIIGQFIFKKGFSCRFTIDGIVYNVSATYNANTIICEKTKFSSQSSTQNAQLEILWGDFVPLDNINNLHITIYKCTEMAKSCGACLALQDKFNCGWCPTKNSCEVKNQCNSLNYQNDTC